MLRYDRRLKRIRVTGKRDAKSLRADAKGLRADASDGEAGCEELKKQMRVTSKRDSKR
ncbi:hypothetical protein VCHA37P193_110149 [Vibrio chagasii]|nr:hypothetical protein VCHA41O249_100160 [Vibrio chagasii]CAH6906971.1 hypothetical protein VCHA37P193_110149 [Vibrio chagasii]CAH7178997.1 hypothetical protein VCHA42O253_120027 [Vibrio chagasii]